MSKGRVGFPGALLSAWFEVSPSDRADFVEFHNREHLAERLAVPGFQRAARFVGLDRADDYLTIYEIDSLATLTSPAYLDRLNNPTLWTQQSLPKLKNSRRAAVEVEFGLGRARGAYLLSVEWDAEQAAKIGARLESWVATIAAMPTIVAVRAGRFDVAASNLGTAEADALEAKPQAQGRVLFVEGVAADPLADLVRDPMAKDGRAGFYRLEIGLG